MARFQLSPNPYTIIMPRLYLAGFLAAFLLLTGCTSEDSGSVDNDSAAYLEDLVITDLVEGEGQVIQAGQRAEVHYTVWFRDSSAEGNRGRMLQSSKQARQTFTFMVGNDSVIQGWHQGVPGMKVGGTRELEVPYRLAYGEDGRMGIPGKQDLVFEIELVSIK